MSISSSQIRIGTWEACQIRIFICVFRDAISIRSDPEPRLPQLPAVARATTKEEKGEHI